MSSNVKFVRLIGGDWINPNRIIAFSVPKNDPSPEGFRVTVTFTNAGNEVQTGYAEAGDVAHLVGNLVNLFR